MLVVVGMSRFERYLISLRVIGMRVKTELKTIIRLAALAVLLLAVFNLFSAFFPEFGAIELYQRETLVGVRGRRGVAMYLEDILVIAAATVIGYKL